MAAGAGAVCSKYWWLAYNRKALAYFLQRYEFYSKYDGTSELLALEQTLRSSAVKGLACIPQQVLLQFPRGKFVN